MSAHTRLRSRSRKFTIGFTILEHAVSLSVIALMLGTIMVPLQTQIENRKTDETRRSLELAQEMLLGFVAANGYFPCPADASSNGQEPLGTSHATGSCPVWHGFLPAALLGFKPADEQGYALDAWESAHNRIRYAVSSQTIGGVPNAFEAQTSEPQKSVEPNYTLLTKSYRQHASAVRTNAHVGQQHG